jgi:hypothetical protein
MHVVYTRAFEKWTVSRVVVAIAAACAVCVSSGCHHRAPAPSIVSVPAGLDAAGVARWVDEQRAACRGRLIVLMDEGGVARNYDTAATTSARSTVVPTPPPADARYYLGLAGVECRPDR